MPDLRPRRGRLLLAAAAALVATSCAGIPTDGTVTVGREISAGGGLDDVDVRVLPPAPQPGMSPAEVVHGFLRAMVNGDADYEIARTYLTRRAAASWDAGDGVTTYDDTGIQVTAASADTGRRAIKVSAPRVGIVDGRGDFAPRAGTIDETFTLTREDGQWRIDRLDDGVLLSVSDAQRSYRRADVYYVNRAGTTLVPEQVLLRPEPFGVATALVRTLLAGPGRWLRPAVHTGFPAGTSLIGNVPIDTRGVAEVNVSAAVRQASPAQLRALSAQLVWTLSQVSGVSAVRLLADGAPVTVHGVPADQPRSAWGSYAPGAPPALSVGFYSRGGRWRGVGGSIAGLARASGWSHLAISQDGHQLAGLRRSAAGDVLVTASLSGPVAEPLVADRLTPPTFDRAGNVYTVATSGGRQRLVEVTPSGQQRPVAVDADVLAAPVIELDLSRDGARVAVVVGQPRHGRLLIGRVTADHDGVRFSDFRHVLPRVGDVRGLTWDGADEVIVTAADASGGREVVAVDVDGYYTPRAISTVGLDGEPVDVAAAPQQSLIVESGHAVWVDADAGWHRLGPGRSPGYAD